MITDQEKEVLKKILEEHGTKGAVRSLRNAMWDRAHELSDMALKEEAKECAEWGDLLGDLLVE